MNIINQKQRAWRLFNDKKTNDARQICEQIRDANIADAETFYLLGCCCRKTEQYTDAVLAFQECLKIKPDEPKSLFELGTSLARLDRCDEAIESYESALKLKPNMVRAHCALADALHIIGKPEKARQHYEKAIKLKPDRAAPHIAFATFVWESELNFDEVIKHIKVAIELRPDNLSHRCLLGNALMEARRLNEALVCFREVLEVTPEFTHAIAGLARLYNIKGQYEESMELIDRLRNKDIYNTTAAIAFTSICKHMHNCDDALNYAKKSLERNTLGKNIAESLHMHIARALDSLERYDEAWDHFTLGNKITEGLYDTVNQSLLTDKMIQVFSPANMMGMPKSTIDTKSPIFIVGMPRSGTSLVEQILSAHPDVCGGGELSYISDLRAVMIQQAGPDSAWPGHILDLKQDDLNRWATVYLNQTHEISDSAVRITDKMPHNFSELGLIQMLFPQAHIIHCNRDPRDTSLSIYFQNFLEGHDYSRNLFHIGVHYNQYLKIMSHWRGHLSKPFLDVQYEELVNNPELVVRQMLKHCNLEWYDGCLDFHKVKRQVHTASYDQVRQPMYKKSVQRWRHYEKYIGALDEGLERGF